MKKCKSCDKEQDLSCFFKHKNTKDGLRNKCKLCCLEDKRRWRNKLHNREKENQSSRISSKKPENVTRRQKYILKYRSKHLEKCLFDRAKNRSKSKKFEINIIEKDIIIPEYCPVLGIPLFSRRGQGKGYGPNSPSLDRFDSNKGYLKDNINVISTRANFLKSDATFEEIEKLYFWMLEEKQKREKLSGDIK